jgi:hypothetical protein
LFSLQRPAESLRVYADSAGKLAMVGAASAAWPPSPFWKVQSRSRVPSWAWVSKVRVALSTLPPRNCQVCWLS